MSRPLRRIADGPVAACVLLASLAGGCLAPSPEPDDWLDFGFRSPEATVRSFLTALADGDRPDLEYLCLSPGLKERQEGTLLGYLVLRDELKQQMPWLSLAARAEVESVEYLAPDRARVLARLDWLIWDESLVVELVAEGYFEYWGGARRLEDGYLAFAPSPQGAAVVLALPPPEEADLADVTEIRAGQEWKIDSIAAPPEP